MISGIDSQLVKPNVSAQCAAASGCSKNKNENTVSAREKLLRSKIKDIHVVGSILPEGKDPLQVIRKPACGKTFRIFYGGLLGVYAGYLT